MFELLFFNLIIFQKLHIEFSREKKTYKKMAELMNLEDKSFVRLDIALSKIGTQLA